MTKEEIGKIIRESRLAADLTQLQVAKKLNRPQQTVANWESGKSQPDANTLFELFSVLGRSVDEAFGYNAETPPISGEALKLARDYERLDQQGKDAVRAAADSELDRVKYAHNVALNFGDKLRMCRELARLTRKQLADATEISEKSIKHYESDHAYISFPTERDLQKLASYFHIPPENLLGPVRKIDKQTYEYEVFVLVSDYYSDIDANLTRLNPAGIKMFVNYVRNVAEELPTNEKTLIKDSALLETWMSDIDFTIYRAIGDEARTITELLFSFDIIGLSDVCRFTFELASEPEYQGYEQQH